jgi:hypothetical protein
VVIGFAVPGALRELGGCGRFNYCLGPDCAGGAEDKTCDLKSWDPNDQPVVWPDVDTPGDGWVSGEFYRPFPTLRAFPEKR